MHTRSVEVKHWLLKSKKIIGHVFQWGETYLSKTPGGAESINVVFTVSVCMRGISGSEKPQKDAGVHFNDHVLWGSENIIVQKPCQQRTEGT